MNEHQLKQLARLELAIAQQSGLIRCITYPQQSGLAFGYNQVKQAMDRLSFQLCKSTAPGISAFKKLVPTRYGFDGLADDIVIIEGGKSYQVEYKGDGGKQSKEQKQFEKVCNDFSIPYLLIDQPEKIKDVWL